MSGFALAADRSNLNPCNAADADAAGLSRDLSTDVRALREYTETISRMLKDEKFDQLDCLADRARSSKERLPGGMWKIHELYKGLYEPVQYPQHATEQDWQVLLQRLQRWVATRPGSVTAPVALAWAYIGYASYARGSGYADTVSESGWKLYEERTRKAEKILQEASALPTRCPEWYVVMQNVAQNQGWGIPRMRALFDEAIKSEPGYYYYARALAYDLLPRWYGAPGDAEEFIREVADRIGGDLGDIFYFEVGSAHDVICGCDEDPRLPWERIKRGYEASEKQYGVSMLNLNRIAYLAVNYADRDPVFAEKALARIGDQWDEQTWGKKEDFEAAKKWAAQWAPVVAKTRAVEEAAKANVATPEGARYKAAFEKAYRELLQECVRTDGNGTSADQSQPTKFEAITCVGATGTFEDGWINWMGPVVTCAYRKMRVSHQEQSPLFPLPPHAGYWIRLDLDWADFAAVAAR